MTETLTTSPQLNTPAVLSTAEALESGVPGLRFDMSKVEDRDACGSVSCIIGHALAVRDGSWSAREDTEEMRESPNWSERQFRMHNLAAEAARFLRLPLKEANKLFFPDSWGESPFLDDDCPQGLRDVEPRHAALVLRHLAATGEVEWGVAFDEDGRLKP